MKTFIVLAASVAAQLEDYGFDYNSLGDLNFDNFVANSDVVGADYGGDDNGLGRRERPRRPGQNRPTFNRPANQPAAAGFGNAGFGDAGLAGFDAGLAGFGEADAFGAADNDAFNAEVDAEEDGRYFFTQPQQITVAPPVVIVTTPAPLEGGFCWKCDAMNFADCAALGEYEMCGLGEFDCCFVEIREMYGDLKQLCTGCKQANACENLRKENFQYQDFVELDPGMAWIEDQCRPDYTDQRRNMRDGAQQSVCRQCFQTCRPDEYGSYFCFGSVKELQPNAANEGKFFHVPFEDHAANWPNVNIGAYEFNVDVISNTFLPGFATSMGIPTHLLLDCHDNTDNDACDYVKAVDGDGLFNPEVRNIYFQDIGNSNSGKEETEPGDAIRQLHEMTYWGLQGASRKWWENDLKFIQSYHWNFMYIDSECTIADDGLESVNFSLCKHGFHDVDFIHDL